jgi:16S rRNA C967 or C1407 C5-methylase (RsmB/RsmF family)/NOL1/NOP2/fmu family ribosome biogenesis protein
MINMFPERFKQRLVTQDYIESEDLLKALEQHPPVSIRLNTSKWDQKPVDSLPVTWCDSGYYLPFRPVYTLDPLFHSGCYYPQEASGMFLQQAYRQVTGDRKGLRVLDLCGAPGGKTTLLSDMAGNNGLLVSNEVIRSRAYILSETITKWGSVNTLVTQNDPSSFGRLPGYFDVIVADAPCSGEGMFRNSVAVKEWSYENTLLCADRQKRIIMDVWPALSENGILIYSTCTFNPGENEENIRWLADKHRAECLRLDISRYSGITEIDYNGVYGYGFYPDKIKGEGFFISVIRKLEPEKGIGRFPKLRPEYIAGKKDTEAAGRWTSFREENMLRRGNELFALPCRGDEYALLFKNLKIVSPGTRVSVIRNNDYVPAHELALSQALKKGAFPFAEADLSAALAYLGRNNFEAVMPVRGWNLLTYKGVNMGFVKNLGNRLNNYYPVEWRIRMSVESPEKVRLIMWE